MINIAFTLKLSTTIVINIWINIFQRSSLPAGMAACCFNETIKWFAICYKMNFNISPKSSCWNVYCKEIFCALHQDWCCFFRLLCTKCSHLYGLMNRMFSTLVTGSFDNLETQTKLSILARTCGMVSVCKTY